MELGRNWSMVCAEWKHGEHTLQAPILEIEISWDLDIGQNDLIDAV